MWISWFATPCLVDIWAPRSHISDTSVANHEILMFYGGKSSDLPQTINECNRKNFEMSQRLYYYRAFSLPTPCLGGHACFFHPDLAGPSCHDVAALAHCFIRLTLPAASRAPLAVGTNTTDHRSDRRAEMERRTLDTSVFYWEVWKILDLKYLIDMALEAMSRWWHHRREMADDDLTTLDETRL